MATTETLESASYHVTCLHCGLGISIQQLQPLLPSFLENGRMFNRQVFTDKTVGQESFPLFPLYVVRKHLERKKPDAVTWIQTWTGNQASLGPEPCELKGETQAKGGHGFCVSWNSWGILDRRQRG